MRANSSLVRTAKDGSVGLAGSGAGLSPWRRQGGAAWSTSTSTSLRADGTVRTHTVKVFGGRLGGGGAPNEESDFVFPHPRTNQGGSIRDLLAGLRAQGVEPHPFGSEADDAFVAAILVREGVNLGPLQDRPTAVRSQWFGVDRAQFPIPMLDDPATAIESAAYGTFFAVLGDVANLKAGMFREPVTSDLIWHHIFPEEFNGASAAPGRIPMPVDIVGNLRADDFEALWRFSLMLCAAIVYQVRLFPTVFARGGGEGLNSDPHSDKDVVIIDPTVQVLQPDGTYRAASAPDGTTSQDCIDGKPAHQNSALIPSVWGWDAWYYDPAEIALVPTETSVAYQRYCLNVYNADAASTDEPARTDTYEGMVAVRKSLALQAFGLGIGDYLARWDAALRLQGLALADYVPHLELGAEMDEQWGQLGALTNLVDAPLPSQLGQLLTDPQFRASSREYARFHSMLARGIRAGYSTARIKASELSSWATIPQSSGRSAWLGRALTADLDAEEDLLRQAVEVRAADWAWIPRLGYDRAEDLVDVASSCGLDFPAATDLAAHPLVNVVGFHWFHYWARPSGATGDWGYQSESEAWDYTVEPFIAHVVNACTAAGRPVGWGVGNVGFPSEDPTTLDSFGYSHASAYGSNSQIVQAQSLVRLCLTFVGWGAENVLWFSHMSDKRPYSGGEFATMGLRYDHASETDALPPATTDAWPKASWWALQRLSQLCARARSATVRRNDDGLILIKLCANEAGFELPESTSGKTWSNAYIFWLDGAAHEPTYSTANVTVDVPDGFERVPLVPAATSAGDTGVPYAGSTPPDWDDFDPTSTGRFGNCTQEWSLSRDGTQARIKIYRNFDYRRVSTWSLVDRPADMENLGIVAWLTNGNRAGCEGVEP